MDTNKSKFTVCVANETHIHFANQICDEMADSAKARGTGIARRNPEYIAKKMLEGKAIIAISPEGKWAGFCYIETWSHGDYVANSGLIVSPDYRKFGLATKIKQKAFDLSRHKYPNAKIFGLTTGLPVMKINSELGYIPVTYSELTKDEDFWKGCQSCVNHAILVSKDRKNCLCTAMLYDPEEHKNDRSRRIWDFAKQSKFYERLIRIKHNTFLRHLKRNDHSQDDGNTTHKPLIKRLNRTNLVLLGSGLVLGYAAWRVSSRQISNGENRIKQTQNE